MERFCFTLSIRPGFEAEYDRRHAEMWPEMETALRESGWHNYTLFRQGTKVIGYCECEPDVETAVRLLAHAEVSSRWQESMAFVLVDRSDEDGADQQFIEVWHLNG